MTTSPGSDRTDAQPRPAAATGPALDVVLDLEAHLREVALPLEIPGVERARLLRDRVLAQISSHLVPRLREASLPTMVVVGGPTGAGKSTLVNTLAGADVTQAGVLRPTTRRPVLVINPADAEVMAAHPVSERAEVAQAEGVARGIALLDAPDLDSVDETNRQLAVELVETADVWLFVTTSNRYGDALPWAILDQVRQRGVTIGVVLDRVPPHALDIVRRDLLQRLSDTGFETVPLFTVPDAGPHDGSLAPELVSDIAQWLTLVGSRSNSREIVARTLRGVWGPLRGEVRELLESLIAQLDAAEELTRIAHEPVDALADQLSEDVRAGVLAHGGLTTRWLAAAGAGGPVEPLAHEVTGWFARRRVTRSADARAAAVAGLFEDAGSSFTDVVGQSAAAAEAGIRSAWAEKSDAGTALAAQRPNELAVRERSERLRAAWSGWVAGLAALPPAPSGPDGGSDDLLDAGGRTALLGLAAVGVEGAKTAVSRLWGASDAVALVERAQRDLVVRAHDVLAGEVLGFVSSVADQLSPEVATSLRLRVGELRQLSGGNA